MMTFGHDGAYLIEPAIYGDDWIDFDEWTDVSRFPEYAAFQLMLDILRSPLVWAIVWERKSERRKQMDLETWQARAVYSKWKYYSTKYRNVSRAAHTKATADYFGISVGEVHKALSKIEWAGIPEAA